MTRKETIVRIENHIFILKRRDPRAIYITEALEMVIKALEQELTTKNDLEEAYNKGYEDGVKSVNICPYCGEYIGEEIEE